MTNEEKKIQAELAKSIDLETSNFDQARERFERVIAFVAALHRDGFSVEAKFDISLNIKAPKDE